VGKTTTADAVSYLLAQRAIRHACVDLPQIGKAFPVSDDDPWNEELTHRNLASMWQNFPPKSWRCNNTLRYIDCFSGDARPYVKLAIRHRCRCTALKVYAAPTASRPKRTHEDGDVVYTFIAGDVGRRARSLSQQSLTAEAGATDLAAPARGKKT
jgi:hypothetical protein